MRWALDTDAYVSWRLAAADAARCGVLSRPNSAAIRPPCFLAPLGPALAGLAADRLHSPAEPRRRRIDVAEAVDRPHLEDVLAGLHGAFGRIAAARPLRLVELALEGRLGLGRGEAELGPGLVAAPGRPLDDPRVGRPAVGRLLGDEHRPAAAHGRRRHLQLKGADVGAVAA